MKPAAKKFKLIASFYQLAEKLLRNSALMQRLYLAKSLGHSVVPVVPAPVQLKVKDFAFQKASGVRTDAKVTALINGRMAASDTGELQITNYGISGIPVFQVSRYISRALYEKKNAQVMIDFLPELEEASLRELFSKKLST